MSKLFSYIYIYAYLRHRHRCWWAHRRFVQTNAMWMWLILFVVLNGGDGETEWSGGRRNSERCCIILYEYLAVAAQKQMWKQCSICLSIWSAAAGDAVFFLSLPPRFQTNSTHSISTKTCKRKRIIICGYRDEEGTHVICTHELEANRTYNTKKIDRMTQITGRLSPSLNSYPDFIDFARECSRVLNSIHGCVQLKSVGPWLLLAETRAHRLIDSSPCACNCAEYLNCSISNQCIDLFIPIWRMTIVMCQLHVRDIPKMARWTRRLRSLHAGHCVALANAIVGYICIFMYVYNEWMDSKNHLHLRAASCFCGLSIVSAATREQKH